MGKKNLLFLFIISLIINNYLFSNEMEIKSETSHFNFIIKKVAGDSTSLENDSKVTGFRNMGIAGAVIFGCSLLTLGGGLGMYIYAYQVVANVIASSSDMNDWISAAASVAGLYYGGIALIAVGTACSVVGLTLMIVGFVVSAYYKNKIAFFIENKERNIVNVGLKMNF